jgi:ketosteroid isomerase-like protein
MKKIITSIALCMLIAGMVISGKAKSPKTDAGPTAENLTAAEDGLAQSFRENNADGIQSYLSDDWAVIIAFGQVAEGKELFPSGIRSGYRTLKTNDVSERRARLNGDTGWVTFKLHLVGQLQGKPFDVMERVTDIWTWKDGNWKCVLSHETLFPKDEK